MEKPATLFSGETAGNLERARWRHLARSRGSQSQRRTWLILPAHGASHIMI